MPWRREETAPYHYEDVYTPDTEVQRAPYASPSPRTLEEMDEAYNRAMAGKKARERRDAKEAKQRSQKPHWVPPNRRR